MTGTQPTPAKTPSPRHAASPSSRGAAAKAQTSAPASRRKSRRTTAPVRRRPGRSIDRGPPHPRHADHRRTHPDAPPHRPRNRRPHRRQPRTVRFYAAKGYMYPGVELHGRRWWPRHAAEERRDAERQQGAGGGWKPGDPRNTGRPARPDPRVATSPTKSARPQPALAHPSPPTSWPPAMTSAPAPQSDSSTQSASAPRKTDTAAQYQDRAAQQPAQLIAPTLAQQATPRTRRPAASSTARPFASPPRRGRLTPHRASSDARWKGVTDDTTAEKLSGSPKPIDEVASGNLGVQGGGPEAISAYDIA